MIFRDLVESGHSRRLGNATEEFTISGYTYYTDVDDSNDGKIWHMLQTPDGDVIDIDYTPYDYMDKETVKAFIELGMPERKGAGPLNKDDLVRETEERTIEGNYETSEDNKLLADIGRTLMDLAVTTKDDQLSAAYSKLGSALTGYGDTFRASDMEGLMRTTQLPATVIEKMIDYGHAQFKMKNVDEGIAGIMGKGAMAMAKSMSEEYDPKQIKMAIGIASDPRYRDGNYDGAFATIEKVAKGLARHPKVAAVLKRQNVGEGQFKRAMTDDAQDMDKEEFMNKYSDYGEEEASAMWDDMNEDTVDEGERLPGKLPAHLAKFFDKDGNLTKDAEARVQAGRKGLASLRRASNQAKANWKDVTPKGYGPVDENKKEVRTSKFIVVDTASKAPGRVFESKEAATQYKRFRQDNDGGNWVVVNEARSSASDQAAKAGAYNGGKSLAGKGDGKSDLKHKLKGKDLEDFRAKRSAEYEADLVKKRAENAARLKSYGKDYKKSASLSEATTKKVCKDCGDEIHKPTTDCKHDCNDVTGKNWVTESSNKKKPVELDEGWKSIAAGIALLAALWGVSDNMAQTAYENSPQLQKLISLHQQAEANGNDDYADKLEIRIGNHKTRIDIGKGEVMDKDGNPKVVVKETSSSDVLDAINRIVDNRQSENVKLSDGRALIDLFTASSIKQVYDAVKPATQVKIANMLTSKTGLQKIQSFAMKQLSENSNTMYNESVG